MESLDELPSAFHLQSPINGKDKAKLRAYQAHQQRTNRRPNTRFSLGTGITTNIGEKGRKTGIPVKPNVVKDADDMDNVDDFWGQSSEEEEEEDEIEEEIPPTQIVQSSHIEEPSVGDTQASEQESLVLTQKDPKSESEENEVPLKTPAKRGRPAKKNLQKVAPVTPSPKSERGRSSSPRKKISSDSEFSPVSTPAKKESTPAKKTTSISSSRKQPPRTKKSSGVNVIDETPKKPVQDEEPPATPITPKLGRKKQEQSPQTPETEVKEPVVLEEVPAVTPKGKGRGRKIKEIVPQTPTQDAEPTFEMPTPGEVTPPSDQTPEKVVEKRKRGRPSKTPKAVTPEKESVEISNEIATPILINKSSKGRGRPAKKNRSEETPLPKEEKEVQLEEELEEEVEETMPSVEDSPVNTPVKKKKKKSTVKKQKTAQQKPKVTKPKRHQEEEDEEDEEGVRRSKRIRLEPLQFWRNEKIVYGFPSDEDNDIPVIVDVIKKPATPANNKNVKKIKQKEKEPIPEVNIAAKGEKPNLKVIAKHQEEVEGSMKKNSAFYNSFQEDTFGSGVIVLPANTEFKDTAEATHTFFVHKGAVEVSVSGKSFELDKGAHFWIPADKAYSLSNTFGGVSKVFFGQFIPQ